MDESEGFDQENSVFASMNQVYLEEKTEHLKQKWQKKVSLHKQDKLKVSGMKPLKNNSSFTLLCVFVD